MSKLTISGISNHKPTIFLSIMLGDLLHGNFFQRLISHGSIILLSVTKEVLELRVQLAVDSRNRIFPGDLFAMRFLSQIRNVRQTFLISLRQ